MDSTFRPMSMAQLLDRTIYLYRKNFLLFAGIAFLPSLLPVMMQLVAVAVLRRDIASDSLEAFSLMYWHLLAFGALATTAQAAAFALAASATVHAVVGLQAEKSPSVGDCYGKLRPDAGRIARVSLITFVLAFLPLILATGFLFGVYASIPRLLSPEGLSTVGLLLNAGIVLMIVAAIFGLYALARCSLVFPVCILEKLPARESFRRTRALIKGRALRALGIYLLAAAMVGSLILVFQLPVEVANYFSLKNAGAQPGILSVTWLRLSEVLAEVLAGPVAGIAMVLLYYDERIRKEGLDLEIMMEAVRSEAASGVVSEGLSGTCVRE